MVEESNICHLLGNHLLVSHRCIYSFFIFQTKNLPFSFTFLLVSNATALKDAFVGGGGAAPAVSSPSPPSKPVTPQGEVHREWAAAPGVGTVTDVAAPDTGMTTPKRLRLTAGTKEPGENAVEVSISGRSAAKLSGEVGCIAGVADKNSQSAGMNAAKISEGVGGSVVDNPRVPLHTDEMANGNTIVCAKEKRPPKEE